jgi:hypothetical protein
MALGAAGRRIVWMVLREVLVLGSVGLVVGLMAVRETAAFVKSFFFEIVAGPRAWEAGLHQITHQCHRDSSYRSHQPDGREQFALGDEVKR